MNKAGLANFLDSLESDARKTMREEGMGAIEATYATVDGLRCTRYAIEAREVVGAFDDTSELERAFSVAFNSDGQSLRNPPKSYTGAVTALAYALVLSRLFDRLEGEEG